MGSYVEMNDTLQITKEQGFPKELDWKEHLKKPYTAEQFANKVFEFTNKPNIRNYHMPPVRNFLVENIDGKWLYWGQIHVLEVKHDYINKTTSGKYKIIYINKPEEMEMAHNLIDRNKDTFLNYQNNMKNNHKNTLDKAITVSISYAKKILGGMKNEYMVD